MVGQLGDADGEDLALHRGIPAKERLDAILNSQNMSTQQAVAAMDAMYAENQGTFPHLVVTTVMVSDSWKTDEPTTPHVSYIGPFVDRRAAEAWAEAAFADNDRVTWQVAKVETAAMFEASSRAMREITERD